VTCYEIHVSEIAFLGQPVWNFFGNRLVKAHIHGKAEATKAKHLEIGISFAVLP
jgi:hypothetical protein